MGGYTLDLASGIAPTGGDGPISGRSGTGLALRISNTLPGYDAALAESDSDAALYTRELERHLSRELHDQVANPLISLVIELHRLRTEVASDPDVSQRLALLEESARQTLRQAREILIDLRGQQELRLS